MMLDFVHLLKLRQCTLEHLLTAGEGGGLNRNNCVAACRQCNQARNDKPMEEFFRFKALPADKQADVLRRIAQERIRVETLRYVRLSKVFALLSPTAHDKSLHAEQVRDRGQQAAS